MLNGCHNRQDSSPGYWVQTGWHDDVPGQRVARYRYHLNPMSPGCRHDRKQTDPGCDGCRWVEMDNGID